MAITKKADSFLKNTANIAFDPIGAGFGAFDVASGNSSLGGAATGAVTSGAAITAGNKLGNWLSKVPRVGKFGKAIGLATGILGAAPAYSKGKQFGDKHYSIYRRGGDKPKPKNIPELRPQYARVQPVLQGFKSTTGN